MTTSNQGGQIGEENLTLAWFRVLRFNLPVWCVNHCFKISLTITPVCLSSRKIIKYSSISNSAKKRKKNHKLHNFCNIFLFSKYIYKNNIKFMKSIQVLWLLSRPMFFIVILEDLQVIVSRSWQKKARNRPINCQDFFFVTTHVVQRCFRTTKKGYADSDSW